MALDQRQQELKDRFTRNRGYWSRVWEEVLQQSPDFFEAYTAFSSVPWQSGPLPPKVKEFIYIAANASTTHLYESGLRAHMRNALKYGATKGELIELFELVSSLGVHACTMGVPVLMDEMRKAGKGGAIDGVALSPRQAELKQEFIRLRGYWTEFWDGLLLMSPDFFAAYLDLSAAPWKQGLIPPKVKELIYIAIDAACTHLYEPGLRIHIRNAFQHGATPAEIMEVLQLVSAIGIHTVTMGVPALVDELQKLESKAAE